MKNNKNNRNSGLVNAINSSMVSPTRLEALPKLINYAKKRLGIKNR